MCIRDRDISYLCNLSFPAQGSHLSKTADLLRLRSWGSIFRRKMRPRPKNLSLYDNTACSWRISSSFLSGKDVYKRQLYDSPAHKNATLERITFFITIGTCRNGRYKTVWTAYRWVTAVHQQKATRSVCVFDIAFFKASLPKKCRLLVSRYAAKDVYKRQGVGNKVPTPVTDWSDLNFDHNMLFYSFYSTSISPYLPSQRR